MTPVTTQEPRANAGTQQLARPTSGGWVELARFLSDPLTYLPRLAAAHGGDLVPFRLGDLPCTLVTRPEFIYQGLNNEDWPPITRGRLVNLNKWYSGGLFVNLGEEHHRQRDQIWKPLLTDPAIPKLAAEIGEDWTSNWQEGKTYDLFREIRALCFTIDWMALTGEDLRNEPETLKALEVGCDTLPWLILPLGMTRWDLPLPATLRAKKAKAHLDQKITRLIAERRRNPNVKDLLGKMVADRDSAGSLTTDAQINSNVMMVFGADQLHAFFAWTYMLLAQNKSIAAKMHAELDQLNEPVNMENIRGLTYTRNVMKESMRVMPPVWGFFRELVQDYTYGSTTLPAGSLMAFSPWVTHRDSRYWPDPLRFDPDRWNADAKRPPELSYFPMSAGPYRCHGTELALFEMFILMATISKKWTFELVGNAPKPKATWCTEPSGGMPMRAVARKK